MAENPKQRFRRVLNDLSQDDRTFIDSSLRRIYSESLSYGLKNNFLTKDEVVKYQNLGQQRDAALRKVNVLDPQGQPISKETTVPVMRNGQVVQEKRVTPVTPFDLLRRTGGQMEGGPADGPLFTGYTLDTQSPLGTARKRFQEEVIPSAKKTASELEAAKGETKFFQPGTIGGLTAGAITSIPVGAFKAVTAPLASAISRGVGVFNPEASEAMDTALAKAYYPKATIDVSQPFKTGMDVAEIAGTKFAEAIPASLAALTAGSAVAIPASAVTTPIGGAIAGTATGLAAAAATGQAQNFLTEFALGSSYKPSEKGFGFDIQRSPLSQARAEFMSERTELAPSAAFAGEFAPNLLMGTPTLPKGFVGGLKSGYQATKLGTAGRQALTAASIPTEGLAGRFAATPLAQTGRAIGQSLERIPGVGTAATFGRGFSASPAGQEFLSDITERGVEGSADLYLALKGNAEKPESERDPLWKILGMTALGSMFEGRHRLGDILNAPGQKIGKSIVRGLDARYGTTTPFAYEGLTPSTPSITPEGVPTTPIVPKGRVSGTSTPAPTLASNVVPIGGGNVAVVDPETMTTTIQPAPPVDSDRTPITNPAIGTNVLDAVASIAPKVSDIVSGTYGRVGTMFGRVPSKGGESQLFLGLTADGLAMVKVTDKKTGESSVDLISPDLLIGDNKRIASKAFKAGNLLPSDKTGYQRKGYDSELSQASSYIPTSEGEGPSFDDFDREINISGTPFYGRIVKAVDNNYSVVQVPSPVSGFDMMVVPNDTIQGITREGIKEGVKAGQVAREVLDTTAMNLDMSGYRVDRTKHNPLFKDTDRTTVKGEFNPILLTPDQMSDVDTRKTNIRNYRNQLISQGLPDGTVKDRLAAARKENNKGLDKTISPAVNQYEVGSLIDHVTPSGEVDTAVVVGNSKFGPVAVSTTNPSAPAYIVQESAIARAYGEVSPITKAEAKKAETVTPTPKVEPVAKAEPVKRAEPKVELAKKVEPKAEVPKTEEKPKPEAKKPEPKTEEKPKPVTKEEPEVLSQRAKDVQAANDGASQIAVDLKYNDLDALTDAISKLQGRKIDIGEGESGEIIGTNKTGDLLVKVDFEGSGSVIRTVPFNSSLFPELDPILSELGTTQLKDNIFVHPKTNGDAIGYEDSSVVFPEVFDLGVMRVGGKDTETFIAVRKIHDQNGVAIYQASSGQILFGPSTNTPVVEPFNVVSKRTTRPSGTYSKEALVTTPVEPKPEAVVQPKQQAKPAPTVERPAQAGELARPIRGGLNRIDAGVKDLKKKLVTFKVDDLGNKRNPDPYNQARVDDSRRAVESTVDTLSKDFVETLSKVSIAKAKVIDTLAKEIELGKATPESIALAETSVKNIDSAIASIKSSFNSVKPSLDTHLGEQSRIGAISKSIDRLETLKLPEAKAKEVKPIEPKVEVIKPTAPKAEVKSTTPTTTFTPQEQKVINDVEAEINAETRYWGRVLTRIKGWDTFSDAAKRKIKSLVDDNGAELLAPEIDDTFDSNIMEVETLPLNFTNRVAKVLRPGMIAPDGSKFKAIVERGSTTPVVKPEPKVETPKTEVKPTTFTPEEKTAIDKIADLLQSSNISWGRVKVATQGWNTFSDAAKARITQLVNAKNGEVIAPEFGDTVDETSMDIGLVPSDYSGKVAETILAGMRDRSNGDVYKAKVRTASTGEINAGKPEVTTPVEPTVEGPVTGFGVESPKDVAQLTGEKRFELGKKLNKEQRASILKRVGDSYKDQRHQKEFAGLDSRGEEMYRYPYSTEHMYVSNITGKFIRYYVVIPSDIAQELTGVKRDIYAHPSELFPDISMPKAVEMARMTKSKELRELIAEAESNGFITENESRTAINILPSYVEDKAKPNRTKTIEDIIRKAERINEPNEEVDVLEKAIRDNAKDGIPEFLDAKMLANFAEGRLARTYAFKDINGLPIRQFPGVVTAAKARIKREGATPEVEAPKVNPVVKETAIETADLISEPIFTPEEEGSELNTTLPGDVEILDDPSLVRIQASIEGLGNINDVFRKSRNIGELQQTLVNVITDANQGINPAEAQKYATAISQYYDEWIHAFVNRDLLLAQQLAQGVTAFKSASPSGDAAEYSIFEQPIEESMDFAKRKAVERQNRVARLYQSVDMPRLNNIIDMLNDEAGRKVVALNEEGKYQYLPINFFTKTGEGTALTPTQKADVVAKVQAKLVRERYRTNMPVFAVLSKAPEINRDFNDLFVGEGAYVNIRGNDTNIGQQVVFLTKNNSDPSTIVEELSHALLENMPIDMAREVATKLGKTLREPTSTNTSVTSYELQEMFAARMKLSFLTGEKEAFTGVQGSKATKKRLGEVWDTIQGFMRKAYGRMVDGTAIPADDKPKVEWVVPYNNQTVSLWDKAPILFRNNDGTLSRGVIQPTKKYPGGPGLVRDTMLEKPIVTVKTADGMTVDIAPKSVVALSDFISETPEFGKMMLTFMSGSSGQRGVSVVGLIDSYSKVTKALSDSTYEGLQGKVDEFIDDTDFKYRLDAAGDATQKANAETILKAEMPNRLLGIVNQAYKYGLLSDVSDNPSDSLSLQNWLNVVGVMRSGNGTTSDTFAKGKSTKMSAYDWYRSSIKDLQKAIKDAELYASQLEIQGDYQRLNYNVDADNTGGNVLYSSRQVGDTPRINRALANGQSSNTNPDSQTPGDYAESATRSGMPRESVTPIVERRVIADADRSGLGNSNIRVMELNDVLVIDGTIGLSPVGIDTIGKAIDFAARNNIQNAILVSPATPSEDLGYNDRGGYTVNPSVTFEFENPVTDNMYAVMKRIYPFIRKGLDSRSVTLHNVEEVGKPYEESLNTFEQAVDKIAREISKRRIPVQAIQGAERIWHFGNQSAEGYAIPYYEARNVLHLLKPEIYETGREPVADKRVKSVLEDAISSVSGRSISLPNIDFASVPDNPERRIAMVDNYNRLPDNTYSTNPETKASYDSLMSELDRQFTYLGLSVSTTGSDTPSKFLLTPQPITKGHPLMANSKHKDVDGKPLRYIDILDAVHNSLSEAVQMVSAGEHSDLMAYAAHSAITKDAKALRALYTETLGRSSYETLTGTDVHKASLAPIEDSKTGIVALDKRVQSLYKDSTAPYGDLKKNEVNNAMGRVQYAAGSGTPIYSLRPISDAVISDTGEPDEASADNPVTVVAEDGTETIATSESAVSRILNFLDKNPVTKTLDVINALGRFPMAGDWSAPLVQNWMLANPIESPDLFFKSLMFGPKSLAPNIGFDNGTNIVNRHMFYGRKQVHEMGDVIRSNRFYELAKEANLNLATMEYDRILEQKRKEREEKLEQLRQRDPKATLPEIDLMDIDELDVDPDIQGLLTGERHVPLKAASERAMTMMKDYVKFNKFYQACEHYVELGYDPSSEGFKEMASDMAAILNVMNGDVKFTANEYDKAIGRLMRRVMFAPRWLTSRVIADPILRQAVAMFEPGKKWLKANGIPTDRSLNPYVMRANIRMAAKAQAFWYALVAFFGYMRPFDQFKVQTSVGNMATKIQVGNYVFKAPGGSMMALEFMDSFFKAVKVSAKDSPKEGVKKMTEMMSSFALGRIVNSPAIGIMTEAFTGRDFMGKPVGYIDTDLQSWWEGVARPTMSEIGIPLPDMKLSKFVTKNLMFLWMQSYLETYKMAEDRLEDDKFFEAGFIGAVSALGGRIRYNPPAGKGEYDYDTYGNPPGVQHYILGIDREEWLASPGARTTPEQIEAMEQELLK